jgi:hypothetical protein
MSEGIDRTPQREGLEAIGGNAGVFQRSRVFEVKWRESEGKLARVTAELESLKEKYRKLKNAHSQLKRRKDD